MKGIWGDILREVVEAKAVWLMTLAVGSFTFTLSPEEWKFFLAAAVSVLTGAAGGCWRWHSKDMKKRKNSGKDKPCEKKD